MFYMVSSLINLARPNVILIDNFAFRLHYRYTVLFLWCMCILVNIERFWGVSIYCTEHSFIKKEIMDNFCWHQTTFSVPHVWEKKVGIEIIYPGVANSKEGDQRKYHAYYQWVGLVLFLQGIIFYIPHYLWKVYERGFIKDLVLPLKMPVFTNEKERNDYKASLVDYLRETWNSHKGYSCFYMFCEVLNFINVVGQILLINQFLDGEFTRLGVEVLMFYHREQGDKLDPMIRVFPRLTKCLFHYFGSGGTVTRLDSLCLLPMNILNEKIYIILWFWLMCLAVLSGFVLIYRFILVVSPTAKFVTLVTRARLVDKNALQFFIAKGNMGDWFVMNLMSQNMYNGDFREVVEDLKEQLKGNMPSKKRYLDNNYASFDEHYL